MKLDSETKERAETLILGAGRLHGITAGRDEVRKALDNTEHGPAFIEWAILHLGQDNLLTADELTLYTALDKSGQVDRLAELHDLADVQAVTEDEIRAAIEELNRSTAGITKQTEALRYQQDALSRLIRKAGGNDTRRREFELARQRTSETERKYISAEVEDLSQSISFRLADMEQQATELTSNLNETVEGILGSDDKLLASLQKLGYELDQQDPDEAKTMEHMREICMRLIKNTVETVRTRLDKIYLESLVDAERSGHMKPATGGDVKAMEEEVESLYSEVLSVAQMSVEQQHLEPALRSMSAHGGQSLNRSAEALSYISDCLDHLIDRCDGLRTTIDTLKSHQSASASLVCTAKTALAAPSEPPRRVQKPAPPASPVRPRANTAKSRAAARRSSGVGDDESPLDTLLQSLAVYLPPEVEADGHQKIRALATAVAERSRKNEDVSRGVQESFEAMAATYLGDVRTAVQMLKDSVLAESPYGQVQLVDPEIRGSVDVLAHEVRKVKEGLERVEGSRLTGKSEKKEEIIRRWGA